MIKQVVNGIRALHFSPKLFLILSILSISERSCSSRARRFSTATSAVKEHSRLVPRLPQRNNLARVQVSNNKGVPVIIGLPVVPKLHVRHREVTTFECEKLKQNLCYILRHKKECFLFVESWTWRRTHIHFRNFVVSNLQFQLPSAS